jgi:hypothetical protein
MKSLVLRLCSELTNIDPIATLKALSSIEISSLPINNLNPLRANRSLARIVLADCPNLEELNALSELANVQAIQLFSCPKISDLTPLAGITGLKELTIVDCNSITTLAPLAGNTSLKKLSLTELDSKRLQIPESLLPIIDHDRGLYRLAMVQDDDGEYRTMVTYAYSGRRWFYVQRLDAYDRQMIELVDR